MSTIRMESVTKTFDRQPALAGVDLEIRVGERTAILGPSGAGKTTILRILAGLEKPTAGKIVFDQRDVTELPPSERGAAMVFQDYAVYPQLNVVRNLQASLKASRLSRCETDSRIEEALDCFRLKELALRRPGQLSGGQVQRLALAKAVVRRPSLLLLDEPFSQLDVNLREQLRELLMELHERFALTMLIVTHDPLDAMRFASSMVILDAGRVIQFGDSEAVYRRPASRTAAKLVSPLGVNWLKVQLANLIETDDQSSTTVESTPASQASHDPAAHLTWRLSPSFVKNLLQRFGGESKGKSIWMGFRPEAAQGVAWPNITSTGGGLILKCIVKSSQSLGFASLTAIAGEGFHFKCLSSAPCGARNESVAYMVKEEDLMLFPVLPEEQSTASC